MAENIQAYVESGYKWNGGAYGTPGGTVTWSLATGNYANRWSFEAFMPDLAMDAEGLVAMAFKAWSGVAKISFQQVTDSASADIRLGMFHIDGYGGTTGLTRTIYSSTGIDYVDMALDTADNWDDPGNGFRFYGTILHEIGHALGLDHEDATPALMNSFDEQFGYAIQNLYPDDVEGIQYVYGKRAQVILWGSSFADTLTGAADPEILHGLTGNDWLKGQAGADIIYGNKGVDRLFGGVGPDTLYGGQAVDLAWGEDGNDMIYGNLGADTLYGMTGTDIIYGGQGADVIVGARDNDMIYGNRDNDVMSGGDGNDRFIFAHASGADRINDFTPGTDRIVIKANVNGSGLVTVTDVMGALSDSAAGVQLSLGGANMVQLTGLTVGALSTSDFELF